MNVLRFGAVLALMAVAACGSGSPAPPPSPIAETHLRVVNQAFADYTVYLVQSGQRIRLGTAGGLRTTVFTIPATFVSPGQTLGFLADPIGGSRAGVSQEISVEPGDVVDLTISPN